MERRIVLMRHAKSSWKSDAPNDHARPLNKRGRRDAPRIGAKLAELGWVPDRVVSSDSARTKETWSRMSEAFPASPVVEFSRSLYLAGPGEVALVVRATPDDVRTLMLLGHNDGWEDVLTHLTGADERMTTANAALLLGSGDTWAEAWARAPTWRIETILRPKALD